MPTCKNKGCNGHARRGQYFCYDCYTAWQQGGDEAVAKRIEGMQAGDRELAELKAFKERVYDAVLPAFQGQLPNALRRTELALFEVIHSGNFIVSKLRKEWYDSPDFSGLNVPKHGPGVRFRRAEIMVDWYRTQLDKANKPKPIVLETLRIKPAYGKTCCSDCGTTCYLRASGCEAMATAREKALKHPSAKTTDEAEHLRRKVAELEGKLLVAQQGVIPSVFIKVLCTICMLAGAGFGFLVK